VNENEADAYAKTIEKQIPDDIENEFVQVEQLDCKSYGTTNQPTNLNFGAYPYIN
jgi:hypothetical protein